MKHIVALICLLSLFAFKAVAQTLTVSGHVYEKAENGDNIPLPGVGVTVNKKTVAMTGLDGKFTVKVPTGTTLTFSYTGYKSVKDKITKEENDLRIFMEESVNELKETVVVGYQKQRMADVTSSLTVVNTKDLPPVPASNVMEMLQGRVAGLNIQMNSGQPGAAGSFNIRGVSDVSVKQSGDQWVMGSSAPLFVIDGIPQEDVGDFDANGLLSGSGVSPISNLPYEDIESITVLKDAAATAQYGSQGAYGVILITTKKGRSSKPQIDFSMDMKVNFPPRLRDVIVGRAERMQRIQQILQNDTSVWHGYWDVQDNPALSDSLNPYYNNHTDWQGNFYRRTVNQTYNLAVSGGSTLFNYKVNGNYYTENGIIKNTSFDRYGLRANMGYAPNDKFNMSVYVNATLGVTGNGSGNELSQTGVASGSSASSLLPPPSIYSASNAALGALMIDQSKTDVTYDASMNISYLLPFNIRWNTTVGYKYTNSEYERFTPSILNNNLSQLQGNSTNSTRLYGRTSLSYKTSFWLFRFGLTVMAEIAKNNTTGNSITQKGLANDHLWGPIGVNASSGSAKTSTDNNTVSFSFSPSFGIKNPLGGMDKYIITPSLRPELNSAYGRGAKMVINPGLGLRWNYSEEGFFKKLGWDWFDNGNIRATWGRVVKYKANKYDVWGTYLLGEDTYNGATVIPIDFDDMPNNNLDPVTTTQWNLGTDFSMFNGRFYFGAEAYYKQVDNQISSVDLADHNGFSSYPTTDVSLVNYGLELSTMIRPLPAKSDWDLTLNFNVTLNRDVMTKLPNEARQIINSNAQVVNKLGSNTMSNYLYIYKGVYATDADVPVDPNTGRKLRVGGKNVSADDPNNYFKAGDPIWADLNGDYVIDEKDKAIVGNSQPKVYGGLSFSLRWKKLTLFCNTSFTLKRDIVNAALANKFKTYLDPTMNDGKSMANNAALLPIDAYNFWTPSNIHADYPNPMDYYHVKAIDSYRADQTLFMEDGSYFKISAITVKYDFPNKWLKWLGIRSASIRSTISNLATFSKYSGINPENVSSIGWDNSNGYPSARTFSLGLSIGL